MSHWVGILGRPPNVIPHGSAGRKKEKDHTGQWHISRKPYVALSTKKDTVTEKERESKRANQNERRGNG